MPLTPRGKRVLILPSIDNKEKVSGGGIILTDHAKDKEQLVKGTVVAVSKDITCDLLPGMSVLYEKNAGTEVDNDGVVNLSMYEDSVVCII